jgi:hypothetical protein
MNLLRPLFLTILILALASCGGPTATKAPSYTSADFQTMCRVMGTKDGRISREQFLAQAKDKQGAAQVFDACDANRDNFLTEAEATSNVNYFEDLKRQVILFRTTRP